jgi:metal-responsive CopG/Arc/MetJ family transcriptional regulator
MGRTQTTIRLTESLVDELDTEADERSISRSEYVRRILRERHESAELGEEVATLRGRLESREERIETLEAQLARRSQLEEKIDVLAKQSSEEEGREPFFVKWWKWYRE